MLLIINLNLNLNLSDYLFLKPKATNRTRASNVIFASASNLSK